MPSAKVASIVCQASDAKGLSSRQVTFFCREGIESAQQCLFLPPMSTSQHEAATANAAASLLAALAVSPSKGRADSSDPNPVDSKPFAHEPSSCTVDSSAAPGLHCDAGVDADSAAIGSSSAGVPVAANETTATASADTRELQRCLGVTHDTSACAAWGVRTQDMACQADAPSVVGKTCSAVRHCVAGVAAARIAALCLQHAGWCRAALATVGAALADLREVLKQFRSRQRKHVPVDFSCLSQSSDRAEAASVQGALSRSLKMALAAVEEPFESCLELLEDCDGANGAAVDAETVVYVLANLDSIYYVFLDLHLTSGATLIRLRLVADAIHDESSEAAARAFAGTRVTTSPLPCSH